MSRIIYVYNTGRNCRRAIEEWNRCIYEIAIENTLVNNQLKIQEKTLLLNVFSSKF